jgi:ribosome maturation factor RimP
MGSIQDQIEATLAPSLPDVEVLLVEVVGGATVRLYIDHPDGVTLALCERVSNELSAVRELYALEVSSPGTQRPLTKPHHYRRFLGARARVRLREHAEGRRSYTGELVGASDDTLTLAADTGVLTIPYADIQRATLVGD